jgi:hypothetical protein
MRRVSESTAQKETGVCENNKSEFALTPPTPKRKTKDVMCRSCVVNVSCSLAWGSRQLGDASGEASRTLGPVPGKGGLAPGFLETGTEVPGPGAGSGF